MDSRLENGLDLYEGVSNQGAEQRETSMSNEADMKLNDRFQAMKGYHGHTPDLKIPDLMNWNTLGKAPMQLLFNIVDKVINESIERKNGDVPDPVACILRKLVQEIKLRISCHADKIKSQNVLAKSREGKYQSKVRALEALAVGSAEENQVIMRKLRQIRAENVELEEKKKHDQQDAVRLLREIDQRDAEMMVMKQEIGKAKTSYEKRCLELENELKDTRSALEKKTEELECHLKDSKKKVKQLEQFSEIQKQKLKKKELLYQNYIGSHSNLIQGLRMDLDSVRRDALRTKKSYTLEFQNLGVNLKELIDAADNYDEVLSENRRLYNEVQDLKGNIRVYCRIRPFLPGQNEKQTTIEYIGENGELVVTNALKQGKDNRRLFKFNKVFAQMASQEEIFKDTQPLVRSVLDGYNVCIFAYGQTGSGKTYTMSGPNISSQKDWGVNYRALHDLFQISQSRRTSILYEVCVQMVEIYNEQVRDLLASDGPQKRLGIRSISQTNALAVPEASMYPVNSTGDVLELMNIGLMNRAVGATALNERSSRSHSILTVHVRGTELKSNSVLRGCLHLVDLAGSERVDRSEATGDRLREAQHINKSLSALGDVIFALAQKSSHVPYRNSKLTQVLQSSLGGQAKTLMFVQLNPDLESHSETISTLKFAERVSGVELGAARSNKEGRDLRDLMEQVSFMKEVIARKDEEIEHLRLMKVNGCIERRIMNTEKGSPSSPSSPRGRFLEPTRDMRSFLGTKSSGHSVSGLSYSDKLPENSYRRSSTVAPHSAPNANDEADLLGFRDADSEDRLSDISDSGLSMGTGTDGESTLFREVSKPAETASKRPSITSKFPKLLRKQASAPSSLSAHPRSSTKVVSSSRKAPPPAVANGLPARPKPKPLKKWP